MSIINEALKRSQAPPPLKKPSPGGLSLSWMIAAVSVFVAIGALYIHETQARQNAQAKLQAALLELNDTRGEMLEAAQEKNRVLAEHDASAAKRREVEYDNIEKEKKIAELSKEVHELRMKSQPAPPV